MFRGTHSIWKRLKVVELAKTMQLWRKQEDSFLPERTPFPKEEVSLFSVLFVDFEAERQLLSHDHKRLMLAMTSVVKPPSFPPHNNSNYTFKRLLLPL